MRYQNSEFWNRNSNFLTLQTLEFKKYFPNGIFGIKNGIRIPLTMGSQKSEPNIGIPNLGANDPNFPPTSPIEQPLPPTMSLMEDHI